MLCTDLVAETWEIGSGPGNVGQDTKAGWAVQAHETKGSFHHQGGAWAVCFLLLVTACGLSILFWHVLGHFTAPCLDLVLPWVHTGERHGQRGACADEVDTSVPSLPTNTLMCISSWLTAPGGPKRQHRGASRGRADSALCRDQDIHGHLRQRWHKGDTWTTIRHTSEPNCSGAQHQPHDPAASKAARRHWSTSGEDIPAPSAHGQSQVPLQASREARQ